jgi:hypothetical protein
MNRWVLEGIVVAAVPTLGYTFAFAYELGFCSKFAIPIELIKVELSSVFLACAGVIIIISLIFGIANLSFIVAQPKSFGPISRGLIRLSPVLALLPLYLWIFPTQWKMLILIAGVVVLFVLLEFGFPLLTHKARSSAARKRVRQEQPKTPLFESPPAQNQKMTYREKLESQEEYETQVKTIFNYLGKPVNIGILAFWFVGLLFLISYGLGSTLATRQTAYLIPSTYENSVVLRIYGNNAICTKVVRETGEVNKSFFVIDISSAPSTVFKLEKIGPLTLSGVEAE